MTKSRIEAEHAKWEQEALGKGTLRDAQTESGLTSTSVYSARLLGR